MKKHLGLWIWALTVILMAAGLAALYSASYQNVRVEHQVFYDQLLCAVLGLVIMFMLSRVDFRKFFDSAYIVYGVSLVLLFLVLVAGRHALGAQRWFSIGGVSFQPSEFAKLGLILALGRYFSEHRPVKVSGFWAQMEYLWRGLVLPLLITVVPMAMIFKQPDLGTSLLFFGIFFMMLVASGLRYRYLLMFSVGCLAAMPFAWHVMKPYQRDRLLVFLNPNIDPLGAGYTIIQSKIAIGSGRLFGKGWLAGTQNQLNFLPERHTDFIFSVIGEEWGVLGTLSLVVCFFVLIQCGLKIAEQVNDRFGTSVAVGIVANLTLQVLINMGMVLGLCPVVGLTLPLISYGRSSFMTFVVMLGILLSLSRRRTVF